MHLYKVFFAGENFITSWLYPSACFISHFESSFAPSFELSTWKRQPVCDGYTYPSSHCGPSIVYVFGHRLHATSKSLDLSHRIDQIGSPARVAHLLNNYICLLVHMESNRDWRILLNWLIKFCWRWQLGAVSTIDDFASTRNLASNRLDFEGHNMMPALQANTMKVSYNLQNAIFAYARMPRKSMSMCGTLHQDRHLVLKLLTGLRTRLRM